MKTKMTVLRRLLFCLMVCLLVCIPFRPTAGFNGGMQTLAASAASDDVMRIEEYVADITVHKDRKIEFKERITMRALRSGSAFTRSLPLEGDKYSDLQGSIVGESSYTTEVDTEDEFLNIRCVMPTDSGTARTYEFSYTMELAKEDVKNGMRLDVIGYGWGVPLHNVSVTMRFPSALQSERLYVGAYGAEENTGLVTANLSEGGKTLSLQADTLEIAYNDTYDEWMAQGITVEFTLEKGALTPFVSSRFFTDDMWKIALGGVAFLACALLLAFFTPKRRDLITTVHVKAPDGMDPMKMGKILDGTVDDEDVTSMIYYFASEGYLKINLENEEDPELISFTDELPDDAPAYQKTLFRGLFARGHAVEDPSPFEEGGKEPCLAVRVSELAEKYYETAKTAKMQVSAPRPMYETRSLIGYFGGVLLAALFALFAPMLMGKNLNGSYTYLLGAFLVIPVALIGLLGYRRESYRYKWKPKRRAGYLVLEIALVALSSALFIGIFGGFFMTEWEKAAICLFVFLPVFITQGALSRTESYLSALGGILGFKDFILFTEEDKIKFMLEEDPELYYKILPYAQVLGVTDEWSEKFAKLTLEPPQWCVGANVSMLDYLIVSRCMHAAMRNAMLATARRQAQGGFGGGSFTGRSGGGGGFGGFGGGGRGGGGGSWR